MEQTLVELTQGEFISLYALACIGVAYVVISVCKWVDKYFYIYK